MKRPGMAGLLILLAFAIAFAVEFNTLLGMLGVHVAPEVYFPVVGALILAVFAGLYLLPEGKDRRRPSA